MPDQPKRKQKNRIVVNTGSARSAHKARPTQTGPGTSEAIVALSVIVAAALATFLALFLTSRPFDPMSATLEAQQVVPTGPSLSPTPKASPTGTPALASQTPVNEGTPGSPGGQTSTDTPNDATIQSQIESTLASDPVLAKLDVSTLVENGKVTIVGSVRSVELKQRVERAIRSTRGVSSIDNQLVITEATP